MARKKAEKEIEKTPMAISLDFESENVEKVIFYTKDLIGIDAAAEAMGVSRVQIYRYIWNGYLIPLIFGRKVYFAVSNLKQLKKLIASGKIRTRKDKKKGGKNAEQEQ